MKASTQTIPRLGSLDLWLKDFLANKNRLISRNYKRRHGLEILTQILEFLNKILEKFLSSDGLL